MRYFCAVLALSVCMAVGGCAKQVPKDWVPTSGSRSDAVVKLSFSYNPVSEIPEVNEQQALSVAKRRCERWGYTDVEAFGGVIQQCSQLIAQPFGGFQCVYMLITKEYQCIGRGDAATPAEKDADTQDKKESVERM